METPGPQRLLVSLDDGATYVEVDVLKIRVEPMALAKGGVGTLRYTMTGDASDTELIANGKVITSANGTHLNELECLEDFESQKKDDEA